MARTLASVDSGEGGRCLYRLVNTMVMTRLLPIARSRTTTCIEKGASRSYIDLVPDASTTKENFTEDPAAHKLFSIPLFHHVLYASLPHKSCFWTGSRERSRRGQRSRRFELLEFGGVEARYECLTSCTSLRRTMLPGLKVSQLHHNQQSQVKFWVPIAQHHMS